MATEYCVLAERLLAGIRSSHEALLAHTSASAAERQALTGLYQAFAAGVVGLSEEELLATPAPEEWSMAEVLEHVAEHDRKFDEYHRLGLGHYVEHGLEHALQLWRLRPPAPPTPPAGAGAERRTAGDGQGPGEGTPGPAGTPSVFTQIIEGRLPARFVWRDERCVAFLTIAPLRPGHTLVVPRAEIDHWLDVPSDLMAHLMTVAQGIGRALQRAFQPVRVGLVIAGFEVPHVHLHLIPANDLRDLDFSRAERNPDPAALDEAAARIRTALRELGYPQVAG